MGVSYTKEFDDIATSTNAGMIPTLFSQVLVNHPFYSRVTKNVQFSNFAQNRVEVKVRAGKSSNIAWMSSAAGEWNFQNDSLMTSGWFSPALLCGAVTYTETEKEENSGKEQIIDLQQVKMDTLYESFDSELSTALYGDGSGYKTLGLGALVPVSPGSNTVGNLSEAQYPFWVPFYRGSCGSWATNGYFGSTTDYVINAMNTCADGQKYPDLILTDQTTWERFHRSLGAKVQYVNNDSFGNIGKFTLRILNTELVWDRECDANTMFFLHTDYFRWTVSPGLNFKVLPMMRLPKQPLVSYNFMALRHQMVVTRRNLLGRTDGWTN